MPYDHEAEHQDINARSRANRQRLLDLATDYHLLANRINVLEDHFDAGGVIERLTEELYTIATKLEELVALIERGHHD